MSSLDNIFNDYQFGTSTNESNISPPIPPLSRGSTIQDSLPLTTDRLQKKDRLDVLPFNRHTIQHRRSICCGNIYRRLYNHSNSPMILSKSLKRKDSNNSNASVNSPNNPPTSGYLKIQSQSIVLEVVLLKVHPVYTKQNFLDW